MKRFALFASLVLLAAATGRAQTATGAAFAEGANILNLGIGLGAQYGGGAPFGLAYDRGVTDKLSLGVQVDYYTWKYQSGSYQYTYRFAPMGVRGAYHLTGIGDAAKVDVYGGVALGYIAARFTSDAPAFVLYSDQYGGRLFYGLFAGGRYYFTPGIGAFAELGYGIAWLKLGAAFRF